ncbi:uncharacterized protein LOC112566146 [Pomacea canaliculata]|uniref:uncharacterized protein LOC112566146 n=1 Tax=Pomacea canaliculata TaxID=400727 RepID=UPI000D7280AC|nr:uncharacterized protein LOC112566146 [Pomacea canaliculata]
MMGVPLLRYPKTDRTESSYRAVPLTRVVLLGQFGFCHNNSMDSQCPFMEEGVYNGYPSCVVPSAWPTLKDQQTTGGQQDMEPDGAKGRTKVQLHPMVGGPYPLRDDPIITARVLSCCMCGILLTVLLLYLLFQYVRQQTKLLVPTSTSATWTSTTPSTRSAWRKSSARRPARRTCALRHSGSRPFYWLIIRRCHGEAARTRATPRGDGRT